MSEKTTDILLKIGHALNTNSSHRHEPTIVLRKFAMITERLPLYKSSAFIGTHIVCLDKISGRLGFCCGINVLTAVSNVADGNTDVASGHGFPHLFISALRQGIQYISKKCNSAGA